MIEHGRRHYATQVPTNNNADCAMYFYSSGRYSFRQVLDQYRHPHLLTMQGLLQHREHQIVSLPQLLTVGTASVKLILLLSTK